MSGALILNPDRLFPADPRTRAIARRLHAGIRDLPIISPHGHTDARWFADNAHFPDPANLLIVPDHYVLRLLVSQGIDLADLGVARVGDEPARPQDPRAIWRLFAANYHLFRATPSRLWLDWVFCEVFGLQVRLSDATADHYFDVMSRALATDAFRPRALFERFNIEVLATTEGPLDDLSAHAELARSGWHGRVVTTYRPDAVIDPETPDFRSNVMRFCVSAGQNARDFDGYLAAHRFHRARFREAGATATDHGHPTACTADLGHDYAARLYQQIMSGTFDPREAELFRGQMLTEMAAMAIDDGMVMQLHPAVARNHSAMIFDNFGRDKGGDVPLPGEFVRSLKPLLDRFGHDRRLTLILFTLDEDTYSRELAPLAGLYPALRLGPPWWFHDSPEAMWRFRKRATETAGFHNLVGFNDDTRAFFSIPARHDVARRIDCAFLAQLVAEHRLDEDEAEEVAHLLSYGLAKQAYRL